MPVTPFTPPDTVGGGPQVYYDTTIPAGQSLSDPVDLGQLTLTGLAVSASLWTSAAISFEASIGGNVYGPLYDKDGEVVVLTVPAGAHVVLPPDKFFGVRFIKVRSGTKAAAINQPSAPPVRLTGRIL